LLTDIANDPDGLGGCKSIVGFPISSFWASRAKDCEGIVILSGEERSELV
jgi:hypothetical protein